MSPRNVLSNARMKPSALALLTCACSWLLMLVVHEAGHVLHARLSGGTVTGVVLHPLTISRTDVSPNPHPLFVVWGGPIWGCLLPLLAFLVVSRLQWNHRHLLAFFTGFCLIANGGYLGAGIVYPVGDAKLLIQFGTPKYILLLFGVVTVAVGLWFWHGLGKQFGIGKSSRAVQTGEIAWLTMLLMLIVVVELVLSETF